MTLTIAPTGSSGHDVRRLLARVAELERAQQAEDVNGFIALFDPDAVWITGGGERLIGRDVITSFTQKVLPGGMEGGSVRYEVVHLQFITPDVALTSVDQEYLTSGGQPRAPRQAGRPTYIWHRENGDWYIASGQNTAVPT